MEDWMQMERDKRTHHLVEMMQRSLVQKDAVQQEMQLVQNDQAQQQQQQTLAPLVQNMAVHADIAAAAPAIAQKESHSERKKREQLESARQKAAEQQAAVRRQEGAMVLQRAEMTQQDTMTAEQIKAEEALLSAKLKAVALEEKAALKAADNAGEIALLEIKHRAQAERAKLLGEFARMLPLGSVERKKAMAAKEEQELDADHARRKWKVARIENPVEKKREKATLKRHAHYDRLKKIFRKDNPLAHEDATWKLPTGKTVVNVGRAFFGGTKPMYIFEDRSTPILRDGVVVGYKQYLFKEAVNCIGMHKPEGALVTEAAAALQEKICGPYSIPAYAAVEGGKVLGSFQEKIETIDQANRVDLFAWQTKPEDTIPADMKKEILREHTLDWLLCNFDTKGENFLHRTDGHLCSFDKEASFGKLKDAGAAHMSSDYKPHANDTLYNTLFTQFAKGEVALDLSASLEQVQKVEAMEQEKYMSLFSKMLDQKYGPATEENKARREAEAAIWQRKSQLREEYRTFYTSLIARRRKALANAKKEDDCAGYLGASGQFQFADEMDS